MADIAQYYCFHLLSALHPEDERAKAALLGYPANYSEFVKPQRRSEFQREVLGKVIEAANRLVFLSGQFDEKAAALEEKKKIRLEELEREKNACEKWVGELYENKKKLLSDKLSKKLMPLDDFVKKLKKLWKAAQLAIPAAGALMMGSHFLAQVKDAISHLPVVSQLTPELAGAGLVGLWLLAKLGNYLRIWHLKVAREMLPEKEERRKKTEMERIAGEWEHTVGGHIEEMKELQESLEEEKKAVLEGLRAQYRGLLSKFGYSDPQGPSDMGLLPSAIAIN